MFLEKEDLKVNPRTLDQILESCAGTDDETAMDEAFADAVAIAVATVTDSLDKYYILDEQWDLEGGERNKRLLVWVRDITTYELYGAIPDDEMPERIENDYKLAKKELAELEKGERSIKLPRIVADEDTGRMATRFRWGSKPRRTH